MMWNKFSTHYEASIDFIKFMFMLIFMFILEAKLTSLHSLYLDGQSYYLWWATIDTSIHVVGAITVGIRNPLTIRVPYRTIIVQELA